MTFVILSAGIDLSVGSVLALSGVVMATLLHQGAAPPYAIAAGLAIGFGFGALNGLAIAWGRLPPFIATLGMMSIARGFALLFTEGRPGFRLRSELSQPGDGSPPRRPAPVVITAAVYLVARVRAVVHAVRAVRLRDGGQRGSDAALGRERPAPQDARVRRVAD